jgi:hypothetical protein
MKGRSKLFRRFLYSLALVAAGLVAALVLVELSGRLGLWLLPAPGSGIGQSAQDMALDRAINADNQARAARHPFGFNDSARSRQKPQGISRRVVVLGDSFVWGDGLAYGQAWPKKLEALFAGQAPSVEVMSWGRQGWSTKDELEFLLTYGKDFEIDLLIVGFVANDPDMGYSRPKLLDWRRILGPGARLFPALTSILENRLNNILYSSVLKGWGYPAWEQGLYSPENLTEYQGLLSDFAAACRDLNLPVLFVLTPTSHEPYYGQLIDKAIPLFEAAGLDCFNLYPAVADELGRLPREALRAGPANPHPGPVVTELFSREVFSFLTQSPKYASMLENSP